ncbi:aminoglycoside phosphotransferase family protein [Paracandidimonas soli]|uniref:Aminoglycoside phosphotransferase domain-containing protein n=1 Tax=Paracandidimonas soli TaxID=1917182 RepID=A0A4R3VHA4_9BURK|nr:phosphotransferase [Paracandidimonas soli]TCV03138.1 hypothetical protein EV686_101601 [Paracandidimonas soli]
MQSSPDIRLTLLKQWLQPLASRHGFDPDSLAPASSDASFRRYFRLQAGERSLIVMDAPPPQEDCRPFVHVAGLLADAGVHVPAILEKDLDQGLLLLSDLGKYTYYQAIRQGLDDTALQVMYRQALQELVKAQQASTQGLPSYDRERLLQELTVFPEWYVRTHCGKTLDAQEEAMLAQCFATLVEDNLRQPNVLVLRDFHSPNLMLSADEKGDFVPGVIDFQDALAGPVTYDIASLVMDARTTWEEPQQLDWAIRYWEAARAAGLPVAPDFGDFHRAYEWMGLQRNLRILGVFARLSHRDGKHGYLDHIPRVLAYTRQVTTRYNAFQPLVKLLDRLEDRAVSTGYTF